MLLHPQTLEFVPHVSSACVMSALREGVKKRESKQKHQAEGGQEGEEGC